MTAFKFKNDNELQALTYRELHDEAERTMRMIRSTVSGKASGCFERYLHRIITICIEYKSIADMDKG